jgi:hypothetical protein
VEYPVGNPAGTPVIPSSMALLQSILAKTEKFRRDVSQTLGLISKMRHNHFTASFGAILSTAPRTDISISRTFQPKIYST